MYVPLLVCQVLECFYHLRGKTSLTKYWWNTLANISDLSRIATLSALFGIPSGPGVFLFSIQEHAAIISSPVTAGMVCSTSSLLLIKVQGWPCGNNVVTISSSKIGQPKLGRSRDPTFLQTIWYAVPKGFMLASWHIL